MNLNQLILSVKILITVIFVSACSLQSEYVESHRQLDMVNQEIIEKQSIIKKLNGYILSQNHMLYKLNNRQPINVDGKAVTEEQLLINIEQAKNSLSAFQVQIDKLKIKQQFFKRSFKSESSQKSNLI